MRKQRKIWSVILGILGGMTILNVILFIVGVFSPLTFGLLLGIQVIASVLIILKIIDLTKKLKIKLLEKSLQDLSLKKYDDDPTAIYKELGIPIKYDDTGRILTIYELLGLVPIYDEKGRRVKTIYEELEVNPKFNKDGVERPAVVIIKNRAGKIAKVKSASSFVLTRKLTPEQRERLILLKKLRDKKKEAEEKGDKDKLENINKAIKKVTSTKTEYITPAKLNEIKEQKKGASAVNYKYGKEVTGLKGENLNEDKKFSLSTKQEPAADNSVNDKKDNVSKTSDIQIKPQTNLKVTYKRNFIKEEQSEMTN